MELGKVETINQIIKDLFIDLRRKVNFWSGVTDQTPQARMGYIGQHLVSVVTGHKGGKSGARGYDLILPDGKFGEIKSCYRVDQLGWCLECKTVVSSLETNCSNCGSANIFRNDDSKWLISIQHHEEFLKLVDPEYYFFILFEFEEIKSTTNNNMLISIWKVNPKNYGFSACMADYYYNIRAKSKSRAPFNMWPYMIKFYLTKPTLIYKSRITKEDSIETLYYNKDNSNFDYVSLVNFSKAKTISSVHVIKLGLQIGMTNLKIKSKRLLLSEVDRYIEQNAVNKEFVIDSLGRIIYEPLLEEHLLVMPDKYKELIKKEE